MLFAHALQHCGTSICFATRQRKMKERELCKPSSTKPLDPLQTWVWNSLSVYWQGLVISVEGMMWSVQWVCFLVWLSYGFSLFPTCYVHPGKGVLSSPLGANPLAKGYIPLLHFIWLLWKISPIVTKIFESLFFKCKPFLPLLFYEENSLVSIGGYLACLHSVGTHLSRREELLKENNNTGPVENLFLPIAMCCVVLAQWRVSTLSLNYKC